MKKSDHQLRVEKFMELAKHPAASVPSIPNEATRHLRAKLILEEALETVNALGFNGVLYSDTDVLDIKNIMLVPNEQEVTLHNVADGCLDTIYVCTGCLSSFGLPDVQLQLEVDKNNLAKFGPGHSYNKDGKLIKPPGHKKPDLEGIIGQLLQDAKANGEV